MKNIIIKPQTYKAPTLLMGIFGIVLMLSSCANNPLYNNNSNGEISNGTDNILTVSAGSSIVLLDPSGGTSALLTVPYGTDVTNLKITITVSAGASISPASGVEQDFTHPVVYTVTGVNGTTKKYTITVLVAPSNSKDITAFNISGVAATVNVTGISATVPYGTDITSLSPLITHTGVSINPASGVAQNFMNAVIYTVTAADGTTKDYKVTITIALPLAKDISTFNILGINGTVNANTITLTVPYGTDPTSLTPTITITGASVSPASGVPNNFTNPQTYTVTAADSTTKDYTVTVLVDTNGYLNFDGSTGYVEIVDKPNYNFTGSFTVSTWVKWNINPATGQFWANIIGKGFTDTGWKIQHSMNNDMFEFSVQTTLSGDKWVWSNTQPKVGVWHCVTGVYDQAQSRISIYIDGKLENYVSGIYGELVGMNNPINIGRNGDLIRYFNGSIDDVIILNKAASAAEVLALYDNGISAINASNVISYWNFDSVYDSAGVIKTADKMGYSEGTLKGGVEFIKN